MNEVGNNGRQARPWWTQKSLIGIVFLVGTIAGFLATVFLPVASEQKISKDQRALERQIAASTQQVQNLSRKVELSRLLFDHYFGKSSSEQRAVVTYLTYQFPEDLSKKSLQAILVNEGNKEIKAVVTRSVASIKRVRTSKLDEAIRQERKGFVALTAGDLVGARAAFSAAYRVYPTYHNVDEISRRLLTANQVAEFSNASPARRKAIVKRVVGDVLARYAWGIPPDLRSGLEAAA